MLGTAQPAGEGAAAAGGGGEETQGRGGDAEKGRGEGRGGGTQSGGGGGAAKGLLRVREATFGFSLSMLSLMTALIVGVEARACMALGCNKRAWQVESRPAESSSDRMCASVGPESEHVGKGRDPGSIPGAITNEQLSHILLATILKEFMR